jgi:tripartite-type tricarboxylate transporter receptor subunit TctC
VQVRPPEALLIIDWTEPKRTNHNPSKEEDPMNKLIKPIALACMLLPFAASAAQYPDKPIRMLVGFAPGGGTDTTARAMANKLGERLGQQIIVDNRPGAAGNIATEITSRANPDGYTILMGTIAALAINPSLYKKLPFDPLKDVLPVTRAVDSTNVLVLHPSVPAKDVKELIALAKSKPLNGGSSGVGGAGHLALELFNLRAGTKIVHVPYKGGGPAMIDLLAGNINLIFATAASAVGHIKSGKIKALAVTTAKRSGLVPDLPTVSEAGLKGFEANNWYGVLVPAGTPRPIIDRLNKEITAVLNMADIKEFLFKQGLDVAPSTPEAFGAYIRSEKAQWEKVIKAAGLYHTN